MNSKFLFIGLPFLAAYLLPIALTAIYCAPRRLDWQLFSFLMALAVGLVAGELIRGYGLSHPGSFVDRQHQMMEWIPPMLLSVATVFALAYFVPPSD